MNSMCRLIWICVLFSPFTAKGTTASENSNVTDTNLTCLSESSMTISEGHIIQLIYGKSLMETHVNYRGCRLSWNGQDFAYQAKGSQCLTWMSNLTPNLNILSKKTMFDCNITHLRVEIENASLQDSGNYTFTHIFDGVHVPCNFLDTKKVTVKAGLTPTSTPMSLPTSMPMTMPTSMQTHKNDVTAGTSHLAVKIVVPLAVIIVVGISALIAFWQWKKRSKRIEHNEAGGDESKEEEKIEMSELDSQDNPVTSQAVTKMASTFLNTQVSSSFSSLNEITIPPSSLPKLAP